MWFEFEGGCGNGRVSLKVKDTGVSWSRFEDGICRTIDITTRQLLQALVEPVTSTDSRLLVQYVRVSMLEDVLTCRREQIAFEGTHDRCSKVQQQIDTLLKENEPCRPRRLLLFINPKSGQGTAVRDYNNIVQPVFDKCGVTVESMVTTSKTHARDVLAQYDLSTIDGVVSMGGDGSIGQVTNALIQRTMVDASLDLDQHEPRSPVIPIGTIPGGSGCALALYTCGSVDIETCALSIVLGRRSPLDILGVRSGGRCLGFGNFVVDYGTSNDAVNWLENIKWMGWHRYKLILPAMWWKWRTFDVAIDYLSTKDKNSLGDTDDVSEETTRNNCEPKPITTELYSQWKTINGLTNKITIESYAFVNFWPRLRKKNFPGIDLSTGLMQVRVSQYSGLGEMIANYRSAVRGEERTSSQTFNSNEIIVKGKGESRKQLDDLNMIGIDGESVALIGGLDYSIKVHKGVLSFFGTNGDFIDDLC